MITAKIHNAKFQTRNDEDHWVGSISDDGRLLDVGPDSNDPNDGTKEAALAWVKREALRRGFGEVAIEVLDACPSCRMAKDHSNAPCKAAVRR